MTRRLAAVALLALTLTACTPAPAPAPTEVPAAPAPAATETPMPDSTPAPQATQAPLVDLTGLSQTMAFAELAAMTFSPEDYLGKTVRMQGTLAIYPANPSLGVDYFYTVVMEDATACCQQGLEFVWDGPMPAEGTQLVVTGRYEAYDCGDLPSYHLVADTVETVE